MARPNRIMTVLAIGALAACSGSRSNEAAAPAPAAAPRNLAEEQAVIAVVQRLFDAMRTKDTAAFRVIFAPGARLIGVRTRPTGESVVQSLTWEQFRDFLARDTRGEWLERAFAPEARVRGTLATVWAEYDFHLGGSPTHCGVDAVQLLKTTNGWQIFSIADTFETTGCPARPAPATER